MAKISILSVFDLNELDRINEILVISESSWELSSLQGIVYIVPGVGKVYRYIMHLVVKGDCRALFSWQQLAIVLEEYCCTASILPRPLFLGLHTWSVLGGLGGEL